MIALKAGVSIDGLRPELVFGLFALHEIFKENLASFFCITSCTDGEHSRSSLHYSGLAADVRSKHLSHTQKAAILNAFRGACDESFDLILEAPGQPNEHFHLEFDPTKKSRSTVNPESV